MSQEISVIETIKNENAVDLFKPERVSDILDRIKAEARSVIIDISTEEGRKECASIAYKISRSKTALDGMGKDLVEGWKVQARIIDNERKRIRDELDALKDEIRLPLTEYENREKARVADLSSGIEKISSFSVLNGSETSKDLLDRVAAAKGEYEGKDWQEFSKKAYDTLEETLSSLRSAKEKRLAYEAEQEELARLRKAEEARIQKEREERIAAEAAAKAKAEAEAKAAQERAALEAQKKAEADRAAAAEAAAKKAADDLKAAQEKAKRDAEAAVAAERARQEAEEKARAEAEAKRAADEDHKRKINNLVIDAMLSAKGADGMTREMAIAVISAIVRGQVPNVKISY